MRTLLRVAAVALAFVPSASVVGSRFATAQTTAEATIPVSEAQRQVFAALASANATLEATKRRSDRELRRKLFEIEDLQAEIGELEAEGRATSVELGRLRDQLARDQEQYIADLEARDQVYAKEIATYRRAVEDIVATPEGLAALERFNAGEEAEALAILDRLRAARDLAAARRIAQLALDAWQRSKVSTQSVVARYEEITRLDPDAFWDWIELGRLQIVAGDLRGAATSAGRAADVAKSDRDRSVGVGAQGDTLVLLGDLTAALAAYERGLEIAERLSSADPGNAQAARGVWVSLWRVRQFPESGITWADVALRLEEMDKAGTLLPTDRQFLVRARQEAAAENPND